ncbi:MAG: nucleotidyltransferase family protein [Oscillospiraceae bacterium]|nr:nucleotidyltransferase family protein [Oscillospiraceae bacterium]
MAFGCESGDGEALCRTAEQMTQPAYTDFLHEALGDGLSYAAARQQALARFGGDGGLLERPNDILALEYCKAILEQKSPLKPLALHRGGDYHAESADCDNPSATAVRALLPDGAWQNFVPSKACAHYERAPLYTQQSGERAMLARLCAMTDDEWQNVPFGSEGLWSKVMKAARTERSLEDILTASKSRRYPRTRLQRLLLCAYLGIDADTLAKPAPYVRVLAFDDTGRSLLRQMHDRSALPVIHAGQTPSDRDYAALEARCERLYTLFSTEKTLTSSAKEENGRIYYKKM